MTCLSLPVARASSASLLAAVGRRGSGGTATGPSSGGSSPTRPTGGRAPRTGGASSPPPALPGLPRSGFPGGASEPLAWTWWWKLNHRSESARGHIAVALGMIGSVRSIEPITAIAAGSSQRPELPQHTSIALGLLHSPRVVDTLGTRFRETKSNPVRNSLA